jgi:hypothetical protein
VTLAHGRVVEPLLVFVLVGLDGLFVRLMGAGHFGSCLPHFCLEGAGAKNVSEGLCLLETIALRTKEKDCIIGLFKTHEKSDFKFY